MGQKVLIKVEVEAIEAHSPAIRLFRLRPLRRAAMPAFEPGDHTFVLLPNGLRRPYSLCSDPADSSRWEIAVLREDAGLGGSRFLHDEVREGDPLFVTFPQAGIRLAPEAERHVMVAGGIGITPFLPMIAALRRGAVPWELHYCARSATAAAFSARLAEVGASGSVIRWFGPNEGGRLDLVTRFGAPIPGAHIYCCGPTGMIEAFEAATARWAPDRVHVERFVGLPAEEARHGAAFEVELASTGRRLPVPEDRSLLQVLREAGLIVDASCEGGACGSCRVPYSAGTPVHRDFCLRPEERASTMMACVSRAEGLIRLDL